MTRILPRLLFSTILATSFGLTPMTFAADTEPAVEAQVEAVAPAEPVAATPVEEANPADAAVESAAAAQADAVNNDPAAVAHQEATQKVFGMMNDLIQKIKPDEQKHFFMAYTNYNMISTVKMVQGDVGKAITECGTNNPDMKDKLETRFKTWNDAVNPVMDEAQGHLDNMVMAQEYAKPEEIHEIYKALDEAREKSNKRIEKIPVTTPEACQYLLDKMDETQDKMIELLRATLVSQAQAFPDTAPVEAPAATEEKAVEPAVTEAPVEAPEAEASPVKDNGAQ